MKAVEILLDLYDIQHRGLHHELDEAAPELLTWQPHPEANNITVTVWHLSRMMDILMHVLLEQHPTEHQLWYANGWKDKTGYDPTGKGVRGWGSLNGFSIEEMREVPLLDRADLLAYYDETFNAVRAYLAGCSDEDLDRITAGVNGDRSVYYWSKLILIDSTRHMGEIIAIKALWQRHQAPTEAAG